MTLNLKALAFAGAVAFGASFLIVGILNLIWPSYGVGFMELGASLYPGYDGPDGFGSVIVVTLYAFVDGAVCGAVFGWLYNLMAKGKVEAPAAPRM